MADPFVLGINISIAVLLVAWGMYILSRPDPKPEEMNAMADGSEISSDIYDWEEATWKN